MSYYMDISANAPTTCNGEQNLKKYGKSLHINRVYAPFLQCYIQNINGDLDG